MKLELRDGGARRDFACSSAGSTGRASEAALIPAADTSAAVPLSTDASSATKRRRKDGTATGSRRRSRRPCAGAGVGLPWPDIREAGCGPRRHLSERVTYVEADASRWMTCVPENSIQAIVTDPPYGLAEYDRVNQEKLRAGRGGVWRIPPGFDGARRRPLPRFTVLGEKERDALANFFAALAKEFARILVPGGHIVIASNPLFSSRTFSAFEAAGLEKRGEIIRLVQTLRGGDRPKGAEKEFPGVSLMARACWEPWGIFRKPLDGTAAENLRRWRTGGLRRISETEPFKDVIVCSPARGVEKKIAPHPSLKPQRFMRQIVRAVLPLDEGVIYDPFAGAGSTLAAAEALGATAIGTEHDAVYFSMGCTAFSALAQLRI